MYVIKEVTLRRGQSEKKRLVIEFNDPNQVILGEFLMTDAPLMAGEILQHINEVLSGEQLVVNGSGNRCSWEIDADKAVIDDLFSDMAGDIPTLPSCTIKTKELYGLVETWFYEIKRFENS